MSYLSQVYIQTNALSEAHELLERMAKQEPDHTGSCFAMRSSSSCASLRALV